MTTFQTGDRVKIKPLGSVAVAYHNREGTVIKVLDRASAIWPFGIDIDGYKGPQYFDDSELESLGKNVYARPEPVVPYSEDEKAEPESLTEGVVDAAAALTLLNDAADNRLDMAIEYLQSRADVYHVMFHHMEEADDEQGQLIYALVHDEVRVAIRLLEQHKEETEGVIDSE